MSTLIVMSACCLFEAIHGVIKPRERGPYVYRKPDVYRRDEAI